MRYGTLLSAQIIGVVLAGAALAAPAPGRAPAQVQRPQTPVSSSVAAAPAPPARCPDANPDVTIAGCTAMIQGKTITGEQLGNAYLSRGVAYYRKRDLDHAIADFSETIKLMPRSAVAYNNRANSYLDKADYQRALADYDQSIKLDPNFASALNARCWTKGIVGRDLRSALNDCNAALKLKPNDADTLDTRGFVYLKMRNMNAAIADYDAALTINPRMGGSLYGRGMAKRAKGDQKGSAADIEAAKALRADIVAEYQRYGIQP